MNTERPFTTVGDAMPAEPTIVPDTPKKPEEKQEDKETEDE